MAGDEVDWDESDLEQATRGEASLLPIALGIVMLLFVLMALRAV